jgi:cystathionine beta-synthase
MNHEQVQTIRRNIENTSFFEKKNRLTDLIGNTPLIHFGMPTEASVYLKLEYFNPGGSIKDRSAYYMVEQAENKGLLSPGGTIIEASSGNQGIALAMIGALKGYKVIITVPARTSHEKKATLLAYGAQVIICDETKGEDYHAIAEELTKTIPGAFMPNQYFNADNSAAHYHSTGPEIWKQTNGQITHLILGAGSCGTISGTGRFLKEQNKSIQIIGVDAATSAFSSPEPKPYKTEGLGIDYLNGILDRSVIDQIIPVSDDEAFEQARTMAKKHGILVGPSSGGVLHAAHKVAPSLPKDAVVILILADSGRAYLSKLFPETTI